MVLPLALAQFIASYAGMSTNVAISSIAKDLGTNASGVQTAITLFTLTMAALMIPGSKPTDIWDASAASRSAWWCTGPGAAGAALVLAVIAVIGLVLALLIPRQPAPEGQ